MCPMQLWQMWDGTVGAAWAAADAGEYKYASSGTFHFNQLLNVHIFHY